MGTLLEVGTGFHPELTGRENVFLSGVIQRDGPTLDVVSAYEATLAGQLKVDGLGK
jgi:hypothetical protein